MNVRMLWLLGVMLPLPCLAGSGLFLDVRDFGAVGDGVHDDTGAIQKALDRQDEFRCKEVAAFGGAGETAPGVFIPKGCWRVTRPLVGGRTTFVTGETGAILDGAGVEGPVLYVHLANRCHLSGLHFRGGKHHFCYWTANLNAATLVVEDCLFEGSEAEAVFTESYQAKMPKDWDEDVKMKNENLGPYALSHDERGLPVLKRTTYPNTQANSTLFVMRHCGFKDCGAMYRGYTDGQYFSNLRFTSAKVQSLPVIDARSEFEMTDVKLTANLPKGYPYAWVTTRDPNVFLLRVSALSTSDYGAPLLSTDKVPREESYWAVPRQGWLEECVVSAFGSPSNVLVDFKRTPMALLFVRNCREANGNPIRLLDVGRTPKDVHEMRSSGSPGEEEAIPARLTHRWLFDGNGAEIDCSVPAIFHQCLEKPLPEKVFNGYPEVDREIRNPNPRPYRVFDGAEYGLGLDMPGTDETEAIQKMFDAASDASNPLFLLPGRPIKVDGTIRPPKRMTVKAVGSAVLVGRKGKEAADFFRVSGDGLSIAFEDVGFWNGRRMFDIRGNGRVYVKCATAKNNSGYRCERRGGALEVDVFATTAISPLFAENDGAGLRVRDSWLQFEARPETCSYCINRRGTMLFEHICGVPVSTGVAWASRERRKDIPAGEHYFWIRNEGGTVRTRNFRFGGEFGGVSVLDNYADGRALIESQVACFYNECGARSVFRNADPDGEITLNRVRFMADNFACVKIGKGVLPGRFHRSGDRWEQDGFDK